MCRRVGCRRGPVIRRGPQQRIEEPHAAGLDPDNLPARGAIEIGNDIDIDARAARPKRWRDVWSAGHSTSGVTDILSVAALIDRTTDEYHGGKQVF